MRAVIQRVNKAKVTTNNKVTGEIGVGMYILLGVSETDTPEDALWLSNKIHKLRIFEDEAGKMNLPINYIGGNYLVVSQFTLHASTKKGNRPSFIKAAKPPLATRLYQEFIQNLETLSGKKVETGSFGDYMYIESRASGPVTIIIDTKNKE
ncbi:MAG: D-aminoacyl-tRNA deacylase [Bacteroidota bacterium]|nr:D-aminoacyl-tRNA deacylase [Bacteroidota bacterium]